MNALSQGNTQVRPVRVYLDSSDYSVLSDPARNGRGFAELREQLQAWSDSGEVEFWYSGTHISEMAPLSWRYAGAAVARSECLSRLCKRQALISLDRLGRHECNRLAGNECDDREIYSYEGEWFPEMDGFVSPVSWIDGIKELDSSIKEQGLNRAARRAAKKKLFKNERPRKEVFQALPGNQLNMTELLERYPMREHDARVIEAYMLGKVSSAKAEQAFLESLRDPQWMMQWFHEHEDKLTVLGEWVRGPAKTIAELLTQLAAQLTEQIERREALMEFREGRLSEAESPEEIAEILDDFPDLMEIDAAMWSSQQDSLVMHVARSALGKYIGSSREFTSLTVSEVDERMPGLSTGIRVAVSSWKNSIGQNGRKIKDSDWADCIHAMYAPYVDIFRTDSYMAPIVQDKVKRYGVQVVAKLKALAPTIEEALQKKRSTTH